MASLFKKDDSPYWQLRYRDVSGVWKKRSTKYRIGVGTETADARRECAAQTLRECGSNRSGEAPLWKNWVQDWIDDHYPNTHSRTRAVDAWVHLELWLEAKGFSTPNFVRHEHASQYLKARKKEGAAHNTALLEIKFMASILQEAVRREFISGNPWVKLGIKREAVKEKPEITPEQAAFVEAELKRQNKDQWWHDTWLIVTRQGCRIREVCVPMSDVFEDQGVMHFAKTKGGRPFSTMIHPDLYPLIARRREEKATHLCDMPVSGPKLWWIFLREKLNLPFSIHSARVTVATQMARAKVDRTEAMRYLNHSSELIHRTYQRLRPQDLSAAVAAVGFSSSASAHTDETRENSDSPPARKGRGAKRSASRSASDIQP